MTQFIIAFFSGLLAGGFVGSITMALVCAAKANAAEDDYYDHLQSEAAKLEAEIIKFARLTN